MSGKTQEEAQHIEVLYRARVVVKTAKKNARRTQTIDDTTSKPGFNTALLTARSSEFKMTARSDSDVMMRHRANMTSRSDSELVNRRVRGAFKRGEDAAFEYLSYDEDEDDDFFVDDDNKSLDNVSLAPAQAVTSDERSSDVDSSKSAKKCVSEALSPFTVLYR